MKNKKYIGLLIISIFVITFGIIFLESKNKKVPLEIKKISIAISQTPLSAPFMVADSQGFFSEEGLDVQLKKYFGGHKALAGVLAGEADLATVTEVPVMFNSFKRNDFKIIATFVESYNDVQLITKKSSGIISPDKLIGKKIGTVTGASSQFFLDSFLLYNGVSDKLIKIVNKNPEDLPQALLSGEVSAIAAWQPFASEAMSLLGQDAYVFKNERIYRETFNVVAKRDYIETHNSEIDRLLRALIKSEKFIEENPEKTIDIVGNYLNIDTKSIENFWDSFSYKLGLSQALLTTMEEQARWAIDHNLVQSQEVPNYINYIYTSSLKKIDRKRVTIIE